MNQNNQHISGKDIAIKDIESTLSRESLNARDFLKRSNYPEPLALLPDVKVMKIGGQSITDRGRAAVFPVLEEIVANKDKHKMLLCTGGGTRARHAYQVALDLEMPPGLLAAMGENVARQNARMFQMLLAKHGGIFFINDEFDKLPLYFKMGCLPIMMGMPPYGFWEEIPDHGSIPMNRTDAGTFLTAEVLGYETVFYIKDEDGLYEDDPKKNPKAKFIAEIHVDELIKRNLPDLGVERVCLQYLKRAKHVKRIQIINGLVKGNITRALSGEAVGSIIFRS